jgi:hypothetical protein
VKYDGASLAASDLHDRRRVGAQVEAEPDDIAGGRFNHTHDGQKNRRQDQSSHGKPLVPP